MVVRDSKRAAILFLTYTPPFLRRVRGVVGPVGLVGPFGPVGCGITKKEKTSVSKSSLGG